MMRLPPPGQRVVVRYLLPTGQATDVLGELLSADPTTLVVDGKRGVVHIAVADVVAAKAIPPPPPRRAPRVGREGLQPPTPAVESQRFDPNT